MSEISTIRGAGIAAAETATRKVSDQPDRARDARPAAREDRVELSTHARHLARLADNPIRADLVAEVKAQIEAGDYETEEKLRRAVDALLVELSGDQTG